MSVECRENSIESQKKYYLNEFMSLVIFCEKFSSKFITAPEY